MTTLETTMPVSSAARRKSLTIRTRSTSSQAEASTARYTRIPTGTFPDTPRALNYPT